MVTVEEKELAKLGRREALRGYLEQLEQGQHFARQDGSEAALSAWAHSAGLDSLEMSLLGWEPKVEGQLDGPSLVLEGVALRRKCAEELSQLDRATVDVERDGLRRELAANVAVGHAIMEETQHLVNLVYLSGQIDHAKLLDSFRSRLHHSVSKIRAVIGDRAMEQAQERSRVLNAQVEPAPLPTTHTRPAGDPQPKESQRVDELTEASARADALIEQIEQAKWRPKKLPEQERPRKPAWNLAASRLTKGRLIWVILVIAAAVAVPTIGWLMTREPELPELQLQEFHAMPEVKSILVRPPHLYLTLNPARWKVLGPDDRLRLVEGVAGTASAKGYVGAHFLTADGRLVAQWRQGSGARLF